MMAVKFDQQVNMDAPVEAVWSVLTDASTWPMWFTDADEVTGLSAVEDGATFQWRDGDDTGPGSIVEVNPSANRLKVVTMKGGNPVTHTFDVDRAGGMFGVGGNDARLKYTMEYDPPGGMVGDFVMGNNPVDSMKVKRTLDKVKGLAMMRA
jgi:uncharacterized protein YndB with AHSA1/START domain